MGNTTAAWRNAQLWSDKEKMNLIVSSYMDKLLGKIHIGCPHSAP